jgi:transposase
MGRAYSDDLRIRILEAYERGEGSCRVLGVRFGVSWEYVRKVRQQLTRSGHRRRLVQSRFGVRSRVTDEVRAHMLALVAAQADLTIAELRDKIEAEKGVAISWTLTQNWVQRLGLRLKKSRSMPSSATAKPTAQGAPSSTSTS